MANHVPREEWERRIRAMFAKREAMIKEHEANGSASDDGGAANRAAEIEIAMALWTFDEQVRGTETPDILRAAGMVMAAMVRNLLEPWEEHGTVQWALAYQEVMVGFSFVMDHHQDLQKDHVTANVDG